MELKNMTLQVISEVPWNFAGPLCFILALNFPILLAVLVIVKTGNIHFNFRLLMITPLAFMVLFNLLLVAKEVVFFIFKANIPLKAKAIECLSTMLASCIGLNLLLSLPFFLFIERIIATIYYQTYEKVYKSVFCGILLITAQICIPSAPVLIMHFMKKGETSCAYENIVHICIFGTMVILNAIVLVCFKQLEKYNKSFLTAGDVMKISHRYQLGENVQMCGYGRIVALICILISVMMILFSLGADCVVCSSQKVFSVRNCCIVTVSAMFLILSQKNMRLNCIRILKIDHLICCRWMNTVSRNKYQVSDAQVITNFQQQYFSQLHAQWEFEPSAQRAD